MKIKIVNINYVYSEDDERGVLRRRMAPLADKPWMVYGIDCKQFRTQTAAMKYACAVLWMGEYVKGAY